MYSLSISHRPIFIPKMWKCLQDKQTAEVKNAIVFAGPKLLERPRKSKHRALRAERHLMPRHWQIYTINTLHPYLHLVSFYKPSILKQ